MIALSDLLTWMGRCPPQLTPTALARLPRLELSFEAVCHDLWQTLFAAPMARRLRRQLARLYPGPEGFAALLLAFWLLQAPTLRPWLVRQIVEDILLGPLPELLQTLKPLSLFADSERQEEWVRFWLGALNIQPVDESPTETAERWEQISSQRRAELFALLRLRRKREAAIKAAELRRQQQW